MKWLIVTPEQKITLDAINEKFTDRCCNTEITSDGTLLVGADLIECNYWEEYHDFLNSLNVYDKNPIWTTIP